MKFLLVTLLLLSQYSYSQQPADTSNPSSSKVYQVVEQMPEYPGGEDAMMEFMQRYMIYPDYERSHDITGRVILSFIVDKKGNIGNIYIKKSVSPGIDAEAIRVVKLFPKFKPGMQNGKYVATQYLLPIMFNLSGSSAQLNKKAQDVDSLAAYRNNAKPEQQYQKGMQYYKNYDYFQAKEYFELASHAHYPPALHQLGLLYEYGNGDTLNHKKAFKNISEAADSGYAAAELEKGYIYETGKGVAIDKVEAARWYRKAADQNNKIALANLGAFYIKGYGGLSIDSIAGREYFMRSAALGYARAEFQIGYMYQNGRNGLPKNDTLAQVYYMKAAGQGDAKAQFHIAYMYEHGTGGLDKDEENAMKWYQMAAEQHDDNALNNYAWLCYLKRINITIALRYVQESLVNSPDNINRLDTYAGLLFLHGDYKQAQKVEKKALDRGGDKKAGYLERYGDILSKRHAKKDAMKYWKMAMDMDGHSNHLSQKISSGKYVD